MTADPVEVPNRAARLAGRILRKAREAKNIPMGGVHGISEQTIRRIETGVPRKKKGIDRGRVLELVHIYDIDSDVKHQLLNLVEASKSDDGWEENYGGVNERSWDYFDLEETASSIWSHNSNIIPALLQTPDYIDAIYARNTELHDFKDTAKAKAFRLNRQKKFLGDESSKTGRFIIGEAALLCRVGDHQVMDEQVKWLLDVADRPNIEVLITPLSAGNHYLMNAECTILASDDPLDADTVYLPNWLAIRYFTKHSDVDRVRKLFIETTQITQAIKDFVR